VGCQAYVILKNRVVKPLSNFSLGERIDGILLSKVIKYIYKDLRLLVSPVVESLEGKWGN
jgi:hypothetical protein